MQTCGTRNPSLGWSSFVFNSNFNPFSAIIQSMDSHGLEDVTVGLLKCYKARNGNGELSILLHVHRRLLPEKAALFEKQSKGEQADLPVPEEFQKSVRNFQQRNAAFMDSLEESKVFVEYLLHSRFDMSYQFKPAEENTKKSVNILISDILLAMCSTFLKDVRLSDSDSISRKQNNEYTNLLLTFKCGYQRERG